MIGVLAPARHRCVPTRPKRFDGFVYEKTAMPRWRIDGDKPVRLEMNQAGIQPATVRWAQQGEPFGRRVLAVRIGEQRTHLRRHDRGGQALGIGRQPGGFQVGGGDVRRGVTCRWSLVRCIHARYHIPVKFLDPS